MNYKISNILFLLVFSILFLFNNIFAEGIEKDNNKKLGKTNGTPTTTYLNINNISTVFFNQGYSDIDINDDNSGLTFPKGGGSQAVFKSGFLWGAKVAGDPQPRVGGSAYRTGLQPGKIISTGVAEDPDLDKNRIYRVRPDIVPESGPRPEGYQPGSVVSEIANNEGNKDYIIDQYEKDWLEWPVDDGAEFNDVDNDGVYNPSIDIPGVPGADQTIWFVANDLDPTRTQFLYGANPLGIEMQTTIWAYARSGALGNMFFRKYKIINMSDVTFDSMYVTMWSDVDLGNSTDDFAGSDTTLSMVYCYNANAKDGNYDPLPPPAVGFDFFQGPIVDGNPEDVAIFNGKKVIGKKNLPMTAAYYFARGDPAVTDPTQGNPDGSDQFYNFMQGRIGLSGDLFVDPNTNKTTTFALSGDPQTRTGWLDGQLLSGGDRRIGAASGPFTMGVGDTQEVVVAEICAGAIPGVDRISAIGLLKFYDKEAQSAYDNFFDLPVAPPPPDVTVPGNTVVDAGGQTVYYAMDKQIVLDWGENVQRIKDTESNYSSKGFTFQGYNVYQFPNRSAGLSEAIRVATFDVDDGIGKISEDFFDASTGVVSEGVAQFGNDTGIERFINIDIDEFKGAPLINGIRYYYAVTAYGYNTDSKPNNLETPLSILTVIPTSSNPGEIFGAEYADTLEVEHIEGASDGNVFPVVIDPTMLTGLSYTITFDTLAGGIDVWHADRSDGVRVLENMTNQNADDESPTADGLQFKVIGAPLDFKNFEVVANANGPLDPHAGGALDFGGFPSERPGDDQQVGEGHWAIHTADNGGSDDGGGTRGQYDAFLDRGTRSGGNWPEIIPYDFEMRFNGSNANPGVGGSQAYDGFDTVVDADVVWVPFELWNIGINTPNDPSDDYRMVPWIISNSNGDFTGNASYELESWGIPSSDGGTGGGQEHSVSGADNDPQTDWIYWYRPENISPGEAGYLAAEAQLLAGNYDGHNETEVIARTVLVNWNGGAAPPFNQDLPEEGTIFRLTTNKPNGAGVDVFTFTSPEGSIDNNLAKVDIKNINVFPNPYYAVNSEEINKYNRFVTFTHLPAKAKIRIFDLAGTLVKVIEKESPQQFERWDLANQEGFPVASGLYIAHIDMADLGESIILKLAIVQEQQILDRF